MPTSAAMPCMAPRCSYRRPCPIHDRQRQARSDADRGTAHERGYGVQWRRRRARHLALHPLCADCLEAGRVVAATDAHHIMARRYGGSDEDVNLRSLCGDCHRRRTGRGE